MEQGAELEVAHKWARWLHNPCRLGGPHCFRAGGRIRGGPKVGKVATQPLPPRGSRPLQSGEQNQKWLPHPCLLDGPEEGGHASSLLHPRGAQSDVKSQVAATPPSSRGPKRGRKCYITPAFSGILHKGEQNQKWSPSKRNKGRSGCLTPAFSGPKRGRNCYITPAFSGQILKCRTSSMPCIMCGSFKRVGVAWADEVPCFPQNCLGCIRGLRRGYRLRWTKCMGRR